MKKNHFFLYLFGGAFVILFLVGVLASLMAGNFGDGIKSKERIAVVEVKGFITGGESGSNIFGEKFAGSDTLMRYIRKAAADTSIKALLLHINSPGGSVSATEAVYREVLRFKEKTGKPVLAVMEDVAASGGYYIAVGADEIYANPATVTGSIGVIMQFRNYQELYDKYGIKIETIKSGKYKDIGNPARGLTKDERELLQTLVDQMYERFVKAVMEGRGMSKEEVLKLAQGQIYSGIQAQELNLVDHLGNFYDAVDYLAKKVGIKGEPVLVYYTKPSPLERLFSGLAKAIISVLGESVNDAGPGMMLIEKSLQMPGAGNLQLIY
ncbi:hypothetical protein BBF96_13625 [Anoxybacter fermentans]|uniref:Peptidase S49 domain-containing protein n=1 Tax=Anoxybacter fermentans TaxID=1323375 RepID=A0A3Q9HSN4_9FIRM|nr:signal peptide peptidase SppA [Anoxybacter fermentans]AZR74338.1 hypothetical protein BBF96_13625 [Anoxybacter fermentans]